MKLTTPTAAEAERPVAISTRLDPEGYVRIEAKLENLNPITIAIVSAKTGKLYSATLRPADIRPLASAGFAIHGAQVQIDRN